MPVSNRTVLPFRGLASSARHASAMRLASSGADQRDHNARGALPNIAPPSSFCELPRIDQSFMRPIVSRGVVNGPLARRIGGQMEDEGATFGLRGGHADRADRAIGRQA